MNTPNNRRRVKAHPVISVAIALFGLGMIVLGIGMSASVILLPFGIPTFLAGVIMLFGCHDAAAEPVDEESQK